jgi:hypothetical protein
MGEYISPHIPNWISPNGLKLADASAAGVEAKVFQPEIII